MIVDISIIIICITILLSIIILYRVINKAIEVYIDNIRLKTQELYLSVYTKDSESSTYEVLSNTIDGIINHELDKYVLYNLGYKESVYIPEAEQQHMVDTIEENVWNNMPDPLYISSKFIIDERNIKSEIRSRVELFVMEYVINNNSIKK